MFSITRFFGLILCLLIIGCSEGEPEDPIMMEDPIIEEDPIPELEITVTVDDFHMIQTCEGNGTVGEGDLYSTVYIYANFNVGADLTEIAKSPQILHSLGFDQKLTVTGIQVSTTMTPFNGMKLSCEFFIKELDPGGVVQISKTYKQDLIYDEAKACWFPLVGTNCADGSESGESTFSLRKDERMKDSTCDVLIGWSVNITKS